MIDFLRKVFAGNFTKRKAQLDKIIEVAKPVIEEAKEVIADIVSEPTPPVKKPRATKPKAKPKTKPAAKARATARAKTTK